MTVRMIADDLTGALDSAAQFTGRFGAVPVLLRAEATSPAGSFALDLACRDGAEAEAVARTREAAAHLPGAEIAFKKIDSLLRGHWAAELAAVAKMSLFRRIVLAPAFPAQGRVTRRGQQHVQNADGHWATLSVEIANELSQRGLHVSADFDDAGAGEHGTPVLVGDAETQADLDDLVRQGGALRGPILWSGTAGLALALAGVPPEIVKPVTGSHLVVVGSNHSVTHQQVAAVAEKHPGWLVRFDRDGSASARRINRAMAVHDRCIALADLPSGLTFFEAADRIACWLEALASHVHPPANLTVVGGETFAAVCRALQADTLGVIGEWRPGVPASRLADGRWGGTRCFSKSGAFGRADWLVSLLAQRP